MSRSLRRTCGNKTTLRSEGAERVILAFLVVLAVAALRGVFGEGLVLLAFYKDHVLWVWKVYLHIILYHHVLLIIIFIR